MGTRKESVELSLADLDYTTGMAKAAGSTAVLNRELDRLDGSSVKANKSTSTLADEGIRKTGDSSRRASSDLNQFTGRMNLLVTSAVTLGPALLPISATAVPAIAGLTAGLGAAAGAVGVALLAFHGLGDSLKALDAYELSPTAANFKKFQNTINGLSPSAQQLVFRLRDMEGPLKNLQTLAANGLFPGVNQALDSLVTLGPQVRQIISQISKEMGGLAASGGKSLATDADWHRFFDYMKTDARPVLDAFAKAIGNFTAGFASMMVAFRPLSDQFAVNLKHTSETFREWAAGLGDNASFQHFVDYVRENGPKVKEFFSAIGDALVALARAAAPWGSVVLPILTDVSKVFATIADSPIGPVLFEAAAAGMLFSKIGGPVKNAAQSLVTFSTSMRTARTEAAMIGPATQASANTISSFRANLARVGAGAVGLGLIADSARHTGSTLGQLETIAGTTAAGFAVGGPWGAAIGGGIGVLQVLTSESDKATVSLKDLSSTLDDTGAATGKTFAGIAAELQANGLVEILNHIGVSSADATKAIIANGAEFDQLWWKVRNSYGMLGPALAESLGQIRNGLVANTKETAAAAAGADTFAAKEAEMALQLKASGKAAADAGDKFGGLGKDVNNAKVSLGDFLKQMEDRTRAVTEFGDNAASAARRGLSQGLILELSKMGPEGALRMRQLANATDAELGRASRDWDNQNAAIDRYKDRIQHLPVAKIRIDNSEGMKALADLERAFQNFAPVVHVRTVKDPIPALGAGAVTQAAGGYIRGPGTATSDSIPAYLSNGEYVIKAAAVDKYGPTFFDHVNAMKFAGGGQALTTPRHYGVTINPTDTTIHAIDLFGVALRRATAQLDAQRQAQDSLRTATTSNLTGNLFAAPASMGAFSSSYAAGSLGAVNAQLRLETRNAQLQTKLEKNLRARGLSGAALQDLITNGGLPALQQFAAGSNADLATYQHLYGVRGAAVNQAASTAVQVTSDPRVVAEIKELRRDLNQYNQEHGQAAKKHPQRLAAALNDVAKKARQ